MPGGRAYRYGGAVAEIFRQTVIQTDKPSFNKAKVSSHLSTSSSKIDGDDMMQASSQPLSAISEEYRSRPPSAERGARIAWIDTCKGIGIALVVLGHMEKSRGQELIYVFHMPLFFFLAGYCHKVTSSFKSFFQSKTIHLLVPYLCFLIVYAPLEWHDLRKSGTIHAGKQALIDLAWGGDHLHGGLAVFWFITCLFLTQQIMNWLLAKFNSSIVTAICVLSLTLSYVNSMYFPQVSLPLGLNVVLAAVPIYYLGYAAKTWNLDSWAMRIGCLGGVALGVLLVFKSVAIEYDMRDAVYGIPVLTLGLSLAYILTVITFSKWLSISRPVASVLGKLGTASMGIMFLHMFIAQKLRYWLHLENAALLLAVLVLLVSFGITMALFQWRATRALLLGSKKDFMALVS